MLNKITGWESRTVPPLYVLIPASFGENRSLGRISGKAEAGAETVLPQGMSQKTYEVCSPTVCESWMVCFVAEKRLRYSEQSAAAYLFQEEIL